MTKPNSNDWHYERMLWEEIDQRALKRLSEVWCYRHGVLPGFQTEQTPSVWLEEHERVDNPYVVSLQVGGGVLHIDVFEFSKEASQHLTAGNFHRHVFGCRLGGRCGGCGRRGGWRCTC